MMKKIDMHSYVTAFPQYVAPHADGSRFLSAEEQIALQEKLNIDISVLTTIIAPEGQWAKLGSENCKHVATQNPDRFQWFCGIDPRMGGFRDNTKFDSILGQFIAMGAKGVGEIAASIYVDDAMMDNLFSYCEQFNMPTLVRYTRYYGSGRGTYDDKGLRRTENMLRAHPKLQLICCGEGFWDEYDAELSALMRRCSNLCCVISGEEAAAALMRDADKAASFLEAFSDRIYYGTAVRSVNDTYPFALDAFLTMLVESSRLSREAWERIMRRNAEILLKIES